MTANSTACSARSKESSAVVPCRTERFPEKTAAGLSALARQVAGEAEILSIAVQAKVARAGLGWRLHAGSNA